MTKINLNSEVIQFIYSSYIVGEKVKLSNPVLTSYKIEPDKAAEICEKYVINTGADAPLVALFPKDLSVEVVKVFTQQNIELIGFGSEIDSQELPIYEYNVKTPEGISFSVIEDCLKKNTPPKKEKKSKASKAGKEKKFKSTSFASAHGLATSLHNSGDIDEKTMESMNERCLLDSKKPKQVKKAKKDVKPETNKEPLAFYTDYKNEIPWLSHTKKVRKTVKSIIARGGLDENTARQVLLYNDWLQEQPVDVSNIKFNLLREINIKFNLLREIVEDAIAGNLSAAIFIQDIQETFAI